MTSKLTREERLQALYDLKVGQVLSLADIENVKMLSRMALAAMDSEPVAYRWNYGGTTIWRLLDTKPGPGSNPRCPRVIEPLYRHAQKQVVPDDIKLRELFDSWFASDCSFDRSPEASEEDNIAWRESYWYVWQRCRAAMLQARNSPAHSGLCPEQGGAPPAQDGCSPAQNQGWIPVGERMPELDARVLLYFSDYGGHIEDGCIGDEGDGPYHYFFDGDALSHEPTHWMPLPAAPREEKP